jgi:phosphate transport system permease protein
MSSNAGTAFNGASLQRRLFKQKLFIACLGTFAVLICIPIVLILGFVIQKGLPVLTWSFFTDVPKPVGEIGGGVANGIIGSLILVAIAALLAFPVGILTGAFLVEYPRHALSSVVRICIEILQGIPSIVLGILAYLWIVSPMGNFSAFSGGIALSMMLLPLIIRSTEDTLSMIPVTLKEASLSLGVPYYRTFLKVILPTGLSGIMNGALLGISRIAGETAPLLFTAFGNPFISVHLGEPVNALPLIIFNYATSPYQDWQSIAWGASLLLIMMTLGLSLLTKVLLRK